MAQNAQKPSVPLDAQSSGPQSKNVLWLAAVLTLAAFVLRFGVALALHQLELPRDEEPVRVAITFHDTGVIANPYKTPTGPTAHLAPLYPLLLGGLYSIVGTGKAAGIWQTVWGCFISSVRSGAILWLALFLHLGFRTALLSSLLSVFYISALGTELTGAWEAPLVALVLMTWTVLSLQLYRTRSLEFWRALLYGGFCGLSVLLAIAMVPIIASLCLLGLWVFRYEWRRFLLWCGIFWLAALAVMSPWAIRNQHQLGSPILVRSNAGLELWTAYHEGGAVTVIRGAFLDHPSANAEESKVVARLGEVAYNKIKQAQAIEWIVGHRARASQIFLFHVMYFWFFPETNVLHRLLLACFTLTSVCGWILLWKNHQVESAAIIGYLWLCFPMIYYVFIWSSRYRYPMEWTFLITTAVFLDRLLQAFWDKPAPTAA